MDISASTVYYGYVNQVNPEEGEEYVAAVKQKLQRVLGTSYQVASLEWKYLKMGGKTTQVREGTLVWTATGPPYWHPWQATTIWIKEYGKAVEKEVRVGGVAGGGALQLGRPKEPPRERQRKGKREREGELPFPAGKVTRQVLEEWRAKNKAIREARMEQEGKEGEGQ